VTLEDLGNIGEFFGAVGVIVSLVYLAIQVRQNTTSVQASTYQALVNSYSEFSGLVGGDAEVARIWREGLAGSSLTPDDMFRFHMIMIGASRRWENAFYQHERSMLSPAQWKGLGAGGLLALDSPGGRVWWARSGPIYFSDEFREWVDLSLQEFVAQRAGGSVEPNPWWPGTTPNKQP
jgi:hypothetical protein